MKIIDKFFRDKKSNTVIYILLTVGILMLVFANGAKQSEPYIKTDTVTEKYSLNDETEKILSHIEGVGDVNIMMSLSSEKENEGSIESVLVVADGGNNPVVCEKIVRALRVALGVDAHKIEVFERTDRNDDGS